MGLIILGLIALLIIAGIVFVNQPSFGRNPKGERLERIKRSANYKDGQFQNISLTPQLTGDRGMLGVFYDYFFKEVKGLRPSVPVPSVKTDFANLPKDQDVFIWLGHSAYFMQIKGKKYLIDPTLLTGSPLSFVNKPFEGATRYQPADIPAIDYLIITHDHWDHLDYQTIKALENRVGKFVTALGVGEHLEYWGVDKDKIIELDWYEAFTDDRIRLTALPARHFSGRGLVRQKTLWASFMLEASGRTIYIGGDSGYDTFYQKIGQQFPNIDIAILENGQYNQNWAYIHMQPELLPQTIKDLKPKRVITVHHAKYALAQHTWTEPLDKILESSQKEGFRLLTPRIGQVVELANEEQTFSKWW